LPSLAAQPIPQGYYRVNGSNHLNASNNKH
jgi:hypothetical protein